MRSLKALLAIAAAALPLCRYTVRDVAFVDLGDDVPYRLVVPADEPGADLRRMAAAVLLDSNVELAPTEGAVGATLVDPDGRELGVVHMVGVDVNLPYSRARDALAISDGLLEKARSLPWVSLRRALYGAPDHLNLGLHLAFEAPDNAPVDGAHDLVRSGVEAFSALDIVPYRWGRLWGDAMSGRLDPAYLRVLRAMKGACDPEGILHPGASVWET